MNSSDSKPDTIAEQLNKLLSSDMPDEYKTLLKNFQQQGEFYSQLIQHIDNEDKLESFWNLAHKPPFTAQEQTPGFTQILDSIRALQTATLKITAIQHDISQQAAILFKEKQAEKNSNNVEETYQHWLQAGDAAFLDASQRDDYLSAQQQLFDALKSLMQAQQQYYPFEQPSQQSITDLQKGLQQLRTEFAEYKEQTEATIQTLKARIKKHS